MESDPPQSAFEVHDSQLFYGESFTHHASIESLQASSIDEAQYDSDESSFPQSYSFVQSPQEFDGDSFLQNPTTQLESLLSEQYVVEPEVPPQSDSTEQSWHAFEPASSEQNPSISSHEDSLLDLQY